MEDTQILAELWIESATYHADLEPRFVYASDPAKPIERFYSNLLESETALILLALQGDEVVGYISGFIQERPPIHAIRKMGFVDGLFVKPAARRYGIGTQLWNRVLEWLNGHEITKIQLTVASKNPGAIEFWKKHGFSEIIHRFEFNS